MLENYQFTLLIVAVGLGAYLGSYNAWQMDHIDALTAQLAALEHEPLVDKKEGETGTREALAEQKGKISERLEHFTLRLRHSIMSVLLLMSFIILLALRILLWSWQQHPDSTQNRAPVQFLWLDRAIVSVLVVLLLQICVSHIVADVPCMMAST